MNGSDVAPLPIQVLQDQAPVAALGIGLAAQQDGRNPKEVFIQHLLDPALPHEPRKLPLVLRPSHATLSVSVEHLPGRGEAGFVEVLRVAEALQEEREIGAPGETGELGGVVQPHVEEALDAGPLQRSEELGRRLLRETDRIDLRGRTSASVNRTG